MNILILGSEGFIGSNLVRYFKSMNFDVYGCDLYETPSNSYNYFKVSRLSPEWETVFAPNRFTYCINAAGSGNVNYSLTHPFADFESNVLDTIKVLDAIRRHNPDCKYLHISSAAVYGNPSKLPINESAVCKPLSAYGWHKLMSEQLCKEYSALYNIPIVIVRPFSIYGPGIKKQLFWDVFQKFLTNKKAVNLWGTGNESRDFIYIEDVVKCFHIILQKAAMKGEVYNIASGTETKIKDVVKMLFDQLKTTPVLNFNNMQREGDPINWQADISRMNGLGFFTYTPLDKGLSKLAEWLVKTKP